MKIVGYLKTSLIEWPGKISSVIFTPGCNFRCPFCHNADLVKPGKKLLFLKEEEVLADLKSRVRWIDAVVVTGGEPTLQKDLPDFLDKVGNLGFLRMMHTNGTNPEMLEQLLAPRSSPNGERSGVSYIAMDIKGDLENYEEYTNVKCPDFTKVSSGKQMSDVKSSIEVIARGGVDCEFRTTVVPTLHTLENLKSLAEELEEMFRNLKLEIRNCRWFLQQFRPLNTFDKSYLKVEPFSEEKMRNFQKELQKIIPNTFLRGI